MQQREEPAGGAVPLPLKLVRRIADRIETLLQLPRSAKRALTMASDALLCIVSVPVAFTLRLGEWRLFDGATVKVALACLIIWLPVAYLMGVYRTIVRSTGAGAIYNIARSVGALAIALIVTIMLIGFPGIPRTVAIIQPLTFFLLLALSRIVARYILSDLMEQGRAPIVKRALIYGAGAAGQQLAYSVKREPGFVLVGFVDDDRTLQGALHDRHKVYDSALLPDIIRRNGVTDILLAMPNITRKRRRAIVESLAGQPIHVMTLPAMRELVEGSVSLQSLSEIDVADLLGREPVAPQPDLMRDLIAGKVVMVTGAGGSIGSELCRQIVVHGPATLVLVDVSEYSAYAIVEELRASPAVRDGHVRLDAMLVNVADAAAIDRAIASVRPQIIFHAAAYKHVPLVEANRLSGIGNNVFGTLHCVEAAERHGVERFILVSTDKAVRPTNVMGATKRACELILQAMDGRAGRTRFAMVRFGNVLGSSGSVVPLFRRQIEAGGPVTLTHRDITRYFMTIPEAAALVIQAGAMARGGEVYVLDMGDSVRIIDLARTMITLAGMTVRDEANPDGDIAILEVGLRPGEKLYEELLIGGAVEQTGHAQIMAARERMLPWPALSALLEQLRQAIAAGDDGAAMAALGQMVPEYAPAGNDRPDAAPAPATARGLASAAPAAMDGAAPDDGTSCPPVQNWRHAARD